MTISPDVVRDTFFEAALVSALMPEALDGIAQLGQCRSAVLIAADGTNLPLWQANETGRAATARFVNDGWAPRNVQAARTFARNEPRFFSDLDLFSYDEIENEPFYREFLRPNGLAWGCGTVIRTGTENRIVLSVFRPNEDGPLTTAQVRALDALRPSFARAAFVAARLRLEQAQATMATLQAVGMPAAALGRTGRLRTANPLFESLIPSVVREGKTRLHVLGREADGLLAATLGAGIAGASSGITIPIPRPDGTPVVLNLMPIVGRAHDIFAEVEWLMTATLVRPLDAPGAEILEALFDLTPAESRVAQAIGNGLTVDGIARQADVSSETVRKQLKSVLAKTGLNRQAEFVRLVSSVRSLRPVSDRDTEWGRHIP